MVLSIEKAIESLENSPYGLYLLASICIYIPKIKYIIKNVWTTSLVDVQFAHNRVGRVFLCQPKVMFS